MSDYETEKQGDSNRKYQVTVYVCAKCGGPLSLSHNAPPSNEPATEITGASKVNVRIPIHPCDHCYTEACRPLKLLKSALAIADSAHVRTS